jgi:hypothetical protein
MLEILFIYMACSKLSGFAKERGTKATGYCLAFVGIYVVALVLGGILGTGLKIHPVAGAYMIGIPAALITYFAFKSKVCQTPIVSVPGRSDDESYRPPGQ